MKKVVFYLIVLIILVSMGIWITLEGWKFTSKNGYFDQQIQYLKAENDYLNEEVKLYKARYTEAEKRYTQLTEGLGTWVGLIDQWAQEATRKAVGK